MLESKKQQVAMTQEAMTAIQAQYDAVLDDLTSTRAEQQEAAKEAEHTRSTLSEQVRCLKAYFIRKKQYTLL